MGIPTGWDCINWNAGREYGPKRLRLMFSLGWRLVGIDPRMIKSEGYATRLFEKPHGETCSGAGQMWILQNMRGCDADGI